MTNGEFAALHGWYVLLCAYVGSGVIGYWTVYGACTAARVAAAWLARGEEER